MARIEPIPWEALPDAAREMIQEGVDSGMYTTPLPMQIVAYSSAALRAMHDSYKATFRRGVLEPRLVELLRLHSARAGACAPCSASRKDESISEADVACLGDPDSGRFTAREAAALRFFDDLSARHHEIDDGYFRELAKHFSSAEIVELGYLCATNLGGHRFMHCLGVLAGGEPVLAFDPAEVDRSRSFP
jgi:alkylhydroperoxidase family enzyme